MSILHLFIAGLGMILKHLILAQDAKACDTLIRNSQADLTVFDQAIRVTSFILSLNIQLRVNSPPPTLLLL